MADGVKDIFRAKSLERLSTPDRLDQLLRVVKRRSWIPLLGLGGILVLALAWCFLGRVPVTAEGMAVLVRPRQVVPIQVAAAGELLTLDVSVGDTVARGALIGTLELPELKQALEAEETRLDAFLGRSRRLEGFNREQARLQSVFLEQQRARIVARIDALTELAAQARQGGAAFTTQVDNLRATRGHAAELGQVLRARLDAAEKRLREGAGSEDDRLAARESWVANQLRVAEIDVQIQDYQVRGVQALEAYGRQLERIEALKVELEQIALDAHEAERTQAEARLQEETSAGEIRGRIARLRRSLDAQSRILADAAGTVLEVTASVGSRVAAGQRIASMAVDDPNEPLVALAYFDVADGKKIESGMPARISPVTVQKQRFGSMLGEVARVSAYPVTADAVLNEVGNREMAAMLVGNRSRIEVSTALALDPASTSGFRWTSTGGPDVQITPGTSARVTVTIEERAPITLLIPALRGWLGMN